MISKIKDHQLQKTAYVYLRQSTMSQVLHNRESTERQYALRGKAEELGWPSSAIQVLDGDLGVSGASTTGREDFKMLLSDVALGKVGAVLSLEASRLARSSAEWHRLIEICAWTSTLVIDEDGIYDPEDFNDALLLGMKGTMAQAELHFMRARLLGGKINKAKKGELHFPLPVGLAYDDTGSTVVDADKEVSALVRLIFKTFERAGCCCRDHACQAQNADKILKAKRRLNHVHQAFPSPPTIQNQISRVQLCRVRSGADQPRQHHVLALPFCDQEMGC